MSITILAGIVGVLVALLVGCFFFFAYSFSPKDASTLEAAYRNKVEADRLLQDSYNQAGWMNRKIFHLRRRFS